MGVVGLLYLMCKTMCRGRAVYDFLTGEEQRRRSHRNKFKLCMCLVEASTPSGQVQQQDTGNIARYYEADARLHPGRLDSGGAADSGQARHAGVQQCGLSCKGKYS